MVAAVTLLGAGAAGRSGVAGVGCAAGGAGADGPDGLGDTGAPVDDVLGTADQTSAAGVVLVPQDNALASVLTATENVLTHARIRGISTTEATLLACT